MNHHSQHALQWLSARRHGLLAALCGAFLAGPPTSIAQHREEAAIDGDEGGLPKVGEPFRDCDACPLMVRIPSGSFMMGSPPSELGRSDDEGPRRQIDLSEPLAVGVHEVTFNELEAICGEGGRADGTVSVAVCGNYIMHFADDEGWGAGSRPAINMSWRAVQHYLTWLRDKTGREYRLLTEAEWEYAARGGTQTAFFTGGTITTAQANYNGNYIYESGRRGKYRGKTVAVGAFQPNSFGLHDMHGNVWEWVADCGGGAVAMVPKDGSARLGGDCTSRVLRGGSWRDSPEFLRSSNRLEVSGGAFPNAGFRVALTLATDEDSSGDRCECDDPNRWNHWGFLLEAQEFTPTVLSDLPRTGVPAGLEATILAERILEEETEDLVFDVGRRELLIAEIRQVLARIREAYPGMEAVSARPRRDAQELDFQLEPDFLDSGAGLKEGVWEDSALPLTGHEELDSLNAALGLRGVRRYSHFCDTGDGTCRNRAIFYYSKPINPSVAVNAYMKVEGIADVSADFFRLDGPEVNAWKEAGVWHVHFLAAWGDCPSGCIYKREYFFTVKDGNVKLVEETCSHCL